MSRSIVLDKHTQRVPMFRFLMFWLLNDPRILKRCLHETARKFEEGTAAIVGTRGDMKLGVEDKGKITGCEINCRFAMYVLSDRFQKPLSKVFLFRYSNAF